MIERAIPILCKAVKDRSSNTSDKDVVDCLEALAEEAAVHGRPSSPAPEPAQGEVPQPGHAELMMSSDCDIRPRCTVGCRWSRSSTRRRATSHPFVLQKNKEEKTAHCNFSRCKGLPLICRSCFACGSRITGETHRPLPLFSHSPHQHPHMPPDQ